MATLSKMYLISVGLSSYFVEILVTWFPTRFKGQIFNLGGLDLTFTLGQVETSKCIKIKKIMIFGLGQFLLETPLGPLFLFDTFFWESEVQKFRDPFKETRRGQQYRNYKVSAKTEPPGSGSEEISGPTLGILGFWGPVHFLLGGAMTRPPSDPQIFRPVLWESEV